MKHKPTSADLLVIGGGLAGLTAALEAADRGARVVVVAKAALDDSSSSWAQGGIAAAVGDDDSPELHLRDTLAAGRGLCRESAVETLVGEAPERIADLRRRGVEFDPGLGLEGGHSRRRIVHAGGAETGARVAAALGARVSQHAGIDVRRPESAGALLVAGGRCAGAETGSGRVEARATLLATGGFASLWARSTNPAGSVGDGIVLAHRAGAAVADLEFTQFHPTVLAGGVLLLTEALRGEGALLLDVEGDRFVEELAPRDVVARAIDSRGTALLDLRPVDRTRFADLMHRLEDEGYEPADRPVPVAPAAHYSVGGVVTDLEGRTTVAGLYAAGECAATGVHGANRLASNSLLECLVFGRRAALAALDEPAPPAGAEPAGPACPAPGDAVRELLWRDAGVVRDAPALERVAASPELLPALVGRAALLRAESRGCHFRADRPETDSGLDGLHLVFRPGKEPVWERWK